MALKLDGASDYIDCGTDAQMLGDAFTVMGWVYHSGNRSNPLIGWRTTGGATWPGIWARYITNDKQLLRLNNTCFRWWNAPLTTGVWNHVVFTCPGNLAADIANAEYYLGGVLQTVDSTTNSEDGVAKERFLIGRLGSDYSDDNMAEVSLWNRVLPKAEIQSYMHRKLTGGESDLVGYWPMDDAGTGTGVVIKDISGGGNPGVMTGFSGNPWVGGPPVSD